MNNCDHCYNTYINTFKLDTQAVPKVLRGKILRKMLPKFDDCSGGNFFPYSPWTLAPMTGECAGFMTPCFGFGLENEYQTDPVEFYWGRWSNFTLSYETIPSPAEYGLEESDLVLLGGQLPLIVQKELAVSRCCTKCGK